jgi:hypothetical protein
MATESRSRVWPETAGGQQPLPPDAVLRPRYRERQVLAAADVLDEQSYRIEMLRRTALARQGWGVVTGLEPRIAGTHVTFSPGVAIDGYGRTLVVPHAIDVPSCTWDGVISEDSTSVQEASVYVWLYYRLVDAGAGRCREEAWLRVTRAASPNAEPEDPRFPPGVSPADWCFPTFRTPPDCPDPSWPVYLGSLKRTKSATVDTVTAKWHNRPYTTARGERVRAPSGTAEMEIGAEIGGRRFAVRTGTRGNLHDRVVIDDLGETAFKGGLHIARPRPPCADQDATAELRCWPGDLVLRPYTPHPLDEPPPPEKPPVLPNPSGPPDPPIQPGTLVPPSSLRLRPPQMPEPPAPAPWRVYRADTERTPEGDPAVRDLRFEIGVPDKTADPTKWTLSIGSYSKTGTWDSRLTVRSDCTVIVSRPLRVEGEIILGELPADPNDPRFNQASLLAYTAGVQDGISVLTDTQPEVRPGLTFTITGERVSGPPRVRFAITITNGAGVVVNDITVTEMIAIEDEQHIPDIQRPFSLAPGGKKEWTREQATGIATDAVTFTAAALGRGPLPTFFQGQGTHVLPPLSDSDPIE